MSDTPITDASEFKPEPSDGPSDGGYVSATLARQLERELAAANARLADAVECLKEIECTGRANCTCCDAARAGITYAAKESKAGGVRRLVEKVWNGPDQK